MNSIPEMVKVEVEDGLLCFAIFLTSNAYINTVGNPGVPGEITDHLRVIGNLETLCSSAVMRYIKHSMHCNALDRLAMEAVP